jgi:hypothetical protein
MEPFWKHPPRSLQRERKSQTHGLAIYAEALIARVTLTGLEATSGCSRGQRRSPDRVEWLRPKMDEHHPARTTITELRARSGQVFERRSGPIGRRAGGKD